MFYRTFTGLVLCFFLNAYAVAKEPTAKSSMGSSRVARFEVTTLSIEAHRDRQVKYCAQALHLANAQSKGRLLSNQRGLAINACAPLLRNPQCRAAFGKYGPNRAARPNAFRRVTKRCMEAYCPTFFERDRARLCENQTRRHAHSQALDFYTTALRQRFLIANDVHGLRQAENLAKAFVLISE